MAAASSPATNARWAGRRDAAAGAAAAAAGAGASAAATYAPQAQHYLHLDAPTLMEPVSQSVSVFFDEGNRQIFTVRDSASDVEVQTLGREEVRRLRLARAPVVSMKFSPDEQVLAIQRTSRSLQFLNMSGPGTKSGKELPSEYAPARRSKSPNVLLGFNWTYDKELCVITNGGLEFYEVFPEKRSLKLLKSFSIPVNWFVYSTQNRVLLLSSSPQANVIHIFQFRPGQVVRCPKLEIEMPYVFNQLSQKLLERDLNVVNLYNRLYVALVRNNPKSSSGRKAEVCLYSVFKDSVQLTHILALDVNGRFAINLVDNLVVIHHQSSKTSVVFDILWNQRRGPGANDMAPIVHHPVVAPLPLAPARVPARDPVPGATTELCELYSSSWVVFQPSTIIDAKRGVLWELTLQLAPLTDMVSDKALLIDFLLHRENAEGAIIAVLKAALEPTTQCNLSTIGAMFDAINEIHSLHLRATKAGKQAPFVCITQKMLYENVFASLEDQARPEAEPGSSGSDRFQFFLSVLIDYVRSLNQAGISVDHYLYKLVINLLVGKNCYYQLHQFLQYHVVNDSTHVACLLLALESTYPPAFQLALDMLKRLSTANDLILEVLLSKNQLLPALRFVRGLGQAAVATVSARQFLEAAWKSNDHPLFFAVYTFFERRNEQLRKKPDFLPAEGCDEYVAHFNRLFGPGAANAAAAF